MLDLLKKVFNNAPAVDFKTLVNKGAIIVDVRSASEFNSGHVTGAINIPLELINSKVADLKKRNKPVITCCRSGMRSGMAKSTLTAAGIECFNGGAWDVLNSKL